MGKTAAELREEIEIQRVEVGKDLDAIGDRVIPGRIMERKTESVKGRFRGMKESVMGSADETGSIQEGAGAISDKVSATRDGAADLAQSTREGVASVPGRVRSTTQGNPVAVGLVALGFGMIAASMLPASKKERELGQQLQPQLEDAARRASDAGRHLLDEFRPEVTNAVTEVKDQVSESAQRLTDEAKQGAEKTAESVKEAARS